MNESFHEFHIVGINVDVVVVDQVVEHEQTHVFVRVLVLVAQHEWHECVVEHM